MKLFLLFCALSLCAPEGQAQAPVYCIAATTDPNYKCPPISAEEQLKRDIAWEQAKLPYVPERHHNWLRKTARVLANHVTLDLAVGASSGLATAAVYDCRHDNGVERCLFHYGDAGKGEIARAAFTGGMILLGEYGRKQHFKEWFLPAAGVGAFNTFEAVQQWRIRQRRESK